MFQNTHVLKGIERICDKDKILRRRSHSLSCFPPAFKLENDALDCEVRHEGRGIWKSQLKLTRLKGGGEISNRCVAYKGRAGEPQQDVRVTGDSEGRLCLRSLTVSFYPSRGPGIRVNLAHPRLAWRCQRGDEGPGTVSRHLELVIWEEAMVPSLQTLTHLILI